MFSLRPATAEDHPFIIDSWVMSYRGQAAAKDQGLRYMVDQKWMIRALLRKGAALVACLPDERDVIVGWTVTSSDQLSGEPRVHYVFVKQAFRRLGVAKLLLAPFLAKPGVMFGAKSHHDLPIPKGWAYSWMANVRALVE